MKKVKFAKIAIIIVAILSIISIIMYCNENKKLTIEQIIGVNFDDISYIVNDRYEKNTDLQEFRNQYENTVYQKRKPSEVIGTTVAFTIKCYNKNDNVICTIRCSGHGYYFVKGDAKDFSKETLYDYGQ